MLSQYLILEKYREIEDWKVYEISIGLSVKIGEEKHLIIKIKNYQNFES
jgi:hypothetical protein